jgi:hypothetical protein
MLKGKLGDVQDRANEFMENISCSQLDAVIEGAFLLFGFPDNV